VKDFIVKYLAKPFKSCGFAGALRFKILYWAYRLTGWHIRHHEWDFVLSYFPKLADWQRVYVLDVGCSRTLFVYELEARGYRLAGIDLEPFQDTFPMTSPLHGFMLGDIRENENRNLYNFVTCISVLEHIETGQDKALNNMIRNLVIGGRLLLTIPTYEFAQGHPWEGFNCTRLEGLLPNNCVILEYTERAGQICCAIQRTE